MKLSKQKSVLSVRSYSGKTFFGITVITAVIWVNGQIFFFPPREFVGAYLHWPIEVCRCRSCRGIAGERQTHTHTDFDMWHWPGSHFNIFQILNLKYKKEKNQRKHAAFSSLVSREIFCCNVSFKLFPLHVQPGQTLIVCSLSIWNITLAITNSVIPI